MLALAGKAVAIDPGPYVIAMTRAIRATVAWVEALIDVRAEDMMRSNRVAVPEGVYRQERGGAERLSELNAHWATHSER